MKKAFFGLALVVMVGLPRAWGSAGEGAQTGHAARDWSGFALGGGIAFDLSRSANSDDGRFWSQLHGGPWGFVDVGPFELSIAPAVGRIAKRARWCFLTLVVGASLIWRAPVSALGVYPLLGVGFDGAVWASRECLRSDYTLDAFPSGPFREFSALKFIIGFGKDFDVGEERFFRARALGHYGRRRAGNPHPWGGALRLGVGRRL